MAAPTVYEDVTDGNSQISGQLFAGKKFWVAQRCPSRLRYVDLIKTNGGDVVLLEKNADYIIADHMLQNAPAGSTSYKFIEKSIEHGEIQNPDDYPAGLPAGTARTVGSVQPTKGTRAAFTPEEDRILYKWVQDQGPGGLVHGNKIYKELEKNYPRHTWQSWRDRYVKRLSNMPPSAFNVPDNAPPSPPSDAPADPQPAAMHTQANKPTASKSARNSIKRSHSDQVNSVEYTVEDLTSPDLFDKEDWEELYAFAGEIQSESGETYRKAWQDWAEDRRQTAGQWRQYFEKIVLPQWRADSEEKRARIRARVERRKDKEKAQSDQKKEDIEDVPEQNEPMVTPLTTTTTAPNKRKRADPRDEAFESYLNDRCKGKGKGPSAYVLFAKANKWQVWNKEHPELDYVGLNELLMSRWNALSAGDRAPYLAEAAAASDHAPDESITISSQAFLSSSTAVNETPTYITEAFDKALDQLHSGMRATNQDEQDEVEPPTKKHRSVSPELSTQDDPVEISSAATESQQSTEDDESGEKPDEPSAADMDTIAHPGSDSATPRAPRSKASAFDTQAILSSPSQDDFLRALPLPSDLNSDVSQHTTESLEEFSQLINEPQISALAPLEPLSGSSSPSSPSSTTSGDPDPPLTPNEVDEFFDEQRALGFTNSRIAEALKHTRWRPELAAEVLEAWENGQDLPDKRGVWTVEDDEDVEDGDAGRLARLEEKHTMDGWGGVTERLKFLEGCRMAEGL